MRKKAEEYADNEINKMFVDESEEVCVRASTLKQIIKNSYLKGLVEGKPKWHDLCKDPNDLPSPHCLNWVIALYDNGTLWCRVRREQYVDGIFWVNSYHYQIHNVIAWKEIVLPEFPKEIKEK